MNAVFVDTHFILPISCDGDATQALAVETPEPYHRQEPTGEGAERN